jgi:glutathione peroxidase
MKYFSLSAPAAFLTTALIGLSGPCATARAAEAPAAAAPLACPALLNFKFPRLQDDAPQDLCQYSGKVVLVVNTASYCGFTSQYQGLEALYAKYEKRGLVVLGFPSNDFGRQEPGSSKEIADFCYNTYGVKFPMLGKSVVSGTAKNGLYTALEKATGKTPQWNFHKFLIGRDGTAQASFASTVEPGSAALIAAVEKALR